MLFWLTTSYTYLTNQHVLSELYGLLFAGGRQRMEKDVPILTTRHNEMIVGADSYTSHCTCMTLGGGGGG